MPAVMLSGADVADIVETLSHGLADSLNAPLPEGATSVSQSVICEIATGANSVTRIAVHGTRSVVLLPTGDEPVLPPQIDQPLSAGTPAAKSYSLPDSRRAEELIGSARRALRLADVRAAQEEGGKLEEIFDAAAQGQIPPDTLAEGYKILCDIEFAVTEHKIGPPDTHLARAQSFLERAKHVHRT